MNNDLSSKATKQLEYAFLCLLGQRESEYVKVGVAANGCSQAIFSIDGMDVQTRLMMQNPNTQSIYANAAREGRQIAWWMDLYRVGYLGLVIYLNSDNDVVIGDGSLLREE